MLKLLDCTNLVIFNSTYIIRASLNLWSNLIYRKLLPIFYTTFHQTRLILVLFIPYVTCTNLTLLFDVMLQAICNNSYLFFTSFALLISVIPIHKSNIFDSFGITLLKIIGVNIINNCTFNTYHY